MTYQLSEINHEIRRDPVGFMEKCDAEFQSKVERAADLILQNMKNSPVVLLSGPSGSGKTTTARKLEAALRGKGIGTHAISMDDYYKTLDMDAAPRTPEGDIDLESPLLLDMELMDDHFTRLSRGECIQIPHFEFTLRARQDDTGNFLQMGDRELAIFEGIHALNGELTRRHPEAARIYVSTRGDFVDGEQVCVWHTWLRLMRRLVRDHNFRGMDMAGTLKLWTNVRRGEQLYIRPYERSAHFMIDSALPYEVSVMAGYIRSMWEELSPEERQLVELPELLAAVEKFEPIDPQMVPQDSLLREFIG